MKYCRGQAYDDDDASFQRHVIVSGVAKRFEDIRNAAAIPVHCLAHCANVEKVSCSVKFVKEALSFGD